MVVDLLRGLPPSILVPADWSIVFKLVLSPVFPQIGRGGRRRKEAIEEDCVRGGGAGVGQRGQGERQRYCVRQQKRRRSASMSCR